MAYIAIKYLLTGASQHSKINHMIFHYGQIKHTILTASYTHTCMKKTHSALLSSLLHQVLLSRLFRQVIRKSGTISTCLITVMLYKYLVMINASCVHWI